jgi:hypothetical protein
MLGFALGTSLKKRKVNKGHRFLKCTSCLVKPKSWLQIIRPPQWRLCRFTKFITEAKFLNNFFKYTKRAKKYYVEMNHTRTKKITVPSK